MCKFRFVLTKMPNKKGVNGKGNTWEETKEGYNYYNADGNLCL